MTALYFGWLALCNRHFVILGGGSPPPSIRPCSVQFMELSRSFKVEQKISQSLYWPLDSTTDICF